MRSTTLVAALALLPFALAVPSRNIISSINSNTIRPLSNAVNCPISSASISLPADQATLAVPDGQVPIAVALGVGVQNYTCTAAGNYTSAGAVAKLFDISCLYGTPEFDKVQDQFYSLPTFVRNTIVSIISKTPLFISNHYFIKNPVTGTGISPKFAQKANGGAVYTVLAKAGGIPSPKGTSAAVDWLQLKSIDGDWAQTVFRVDTVAGQPPASCSQTNSTISVQYVAKYWFLN